MHGWEGLRRNEAELSSQQRGRLLRSLGNNKQQPQKEKEKRRLVCISNKKDLGTKQAWKSQET